MASSILILDLFFALGSYFNSMDTFLPVKTSYTTWLLVGRGVTELFAILTREFPPPSFEDVAQLADLD